MRYFILERVWQPMRLLWDWSATWPWYSVFVFGAVGAAAPMGEYALSLLCLGLAAFSLMSRLCHWDGSLDQKWAGGICIMLALGFASYVVVDNKGKQPWSHLSSPARGLITFVWPGGTVSTYIHVPTFPPPPMVLPPVPSRSFKIYVHPQFKASFLFTAARREQLTIQINSFYLYLTAIGFKVTTEVPLIGVRPGKAVGAEFITPGRFVDQALNIGADRIDEPNVIVPLYAMWVFRNMLPFQGFPDNPETRFSGGAQALYEIYYVSSFEGKHKYGSTMLPDWIDALWDLRKKYGQDFVDRLLYYSLEDWHSPGPDQDLDDFLWTRFSAGLWDIDNNQEKRIGVMEVMKSRGLPRSKDKTKGQSKCHAAGSACRAVNSLYSRFGV